MKRLHKTSAEAVTPVLCLTQTLLITLSSVKLIKRCCSL